MDPLFSEMLSTSHKTVPSSLANNYEPSQCFQLMTIANNIRDHLQLMLEAYAINILFQFIAQADDMLTLSNSFTVKILA